MSEGENWLKLRSMGLGGSDAAAVLGINPWKSRLQLWHEKVYKKAPDQTENIRLKIGKMMEPMIADEYARKTGRQLEVRPMKIHPAYPFMIANIDREIVKDERGPGILEIKTKNSFVDWSDEDIPMYYRTQLQHYLEVFDYDWGSFAIFDLGTQNLEIIDVERDDDLIDKLIKEETLFWNLVTDKTPPEPDTSKACEKFLREHYKESECITIDLVDNEEATKWAVLLKKAKEDEKIAKVLETEAKNHLMSIMGNAERAVGYLYSITWKSPKDKEEFDLDRFKLDHPKMIKEYLSCEPQTRRFTVRWRRS